MGTLSHWRRAFCINNLTTKKWQSIKGITLAAMYLIIMMSWIILPLFHYLLPLNPFTNDFESNGGLVDTLIVLVKFGFIVFVLTAPAFVFCVFGWKAEHN
jgi:hypothetical protein